jgi:DNA modification methylase
MSYKSVWDFGRGGITNYSVHALGEYPTKIRPIVIAQVVERFSKEGDTIFDPFCGSGTVAVEAKLQGRHSVNYDINPRAVELTNDKINRLDKTELEAATRFLIQSEKDNINRNDGELKVKQSEKLIKKFNLRLERILSNDPGIINTKHVVSLKDARDIDLLNESVDVIITDIPYAGMIEYSDIENDLSNLDYGEFLKELTKSFGEMWRVLKPGKYCVIFVADYRVGASRKIIPVHSDVIQKMLRIGFQLFDLYIWRYYRSGGFRPFGKRPYQAMNIHSYVLCFYKPTGLEEEKDNKPIRYRKRLTEKLGKNKQGKLKELF